MFTSIDSGAPVMVVVGGGFHVGILNGGKYTYDQNFDLYRWEFVYFHDPAIGANRYYTSDDWIQDVCSPHCHQIISAGASAGWESYRQAYEVETYHGFGTVENQDAP